MLSRYESRLSPAKVRRPSSGEMTMSKEQRYPSVLLVRVPLELVDAVDVASSARFVTRSQFVREAVLNSLRDYGVIPVPHVAPGM
jgi:hypothetical protein